MNPWSQHREPRTVVRVEPPVLIALKSTETLETRPIGDGVFKLSEYVHVRFSGIQTFRTKCLGPSVLL